MEPVLPLPEDFSGAVPIGVAGGAEAPTAWAGAAAGLAASGIATGAGADSGAVAFGAAGSGSLTSMAFSTGNIADSK